MEAASTSRRALVAGSVGNVVEWYDFAVYGAFATVIAATYFPDDGAALLAAAAVVAAVASRETAFQPLPATAGPRAELARRGP